MVRKLKSGSGIERSSNDASPSKPRGAIGSHSMSYEAYGVATQGVKGAPVQRLPGQDDGNPMPDESVHAVADRGIRGSVVTIPHLDAIQRSFGRHDVSGVQAHVGGPATEATQAMGAEAYASGNHVAFASAPSLHTAAHEAAHVVQQRGGVQLKGGVGAAGDAYEQHADQVADAVVRGESAEALLDRYASGAAQRADLDGSGRQATQAKNITGNNYSAPSHNLTEIAKTAIQELDGDASKKVLLSTVLSAARLHELPAFTEILKLRRTRPTATISSS